MLYPTELRARVMILAHAIASTIRDARASYCRMMRALTICLAFSAAVAAQNTYKLRDALEWTTALRGRMARMTNHVVDVYGTAGVAALVCKEDPVTGSGLYRDAIASLDNLSDSTFNQKGTTVLPAASFTGLWKFVVPAAIKCDPG